MTVGISYMGTKKYISPSVSKIVADIDDSGPFLDLFSGMCSVASSIKDRPIWCNDIQLFANYVAKARFIEKSQPISYFEIENHLLTHFEHNFRKLEKRFKKNLKLERIMLSSGAKLSDIEVFNLGIPHVQKDRHLEQERKRLAKKTRTSPWRLFSITYAGGYFGINQCLEIDSIRFAIESAYDLCNISKGQYFNLLVALATTLSRCATTTGHFAQYLKIKENNSRYFLSQRRRSIWLEWISIVNEHASQNVVNFNNKNKVFNEDANTLLQKLYKNKTPPGIIYADPPYTSDQYSRYYHIYETLITYNYPTSSGRGRYPQNRFCSKFSLKSQAVSEFEGLMNGARKLGSCFILNYPEYGIINDTKNTILRMLGDIFDKVELVQLIPHKHSTMGASKGPGKHVVNEMIFMAR